MKLSDGEKLILWMLADISDAIGVKNGVRTSLVREAVGGGHAWALDWAMPGIFGATETDERVVSEVVNYMDMWSAIESSYADLSTEGKAELEGKAGVFGKDPKFRGFDGNNETDHWSAARMLIDHLDRFTSFAGRDLNSHMPSLDSYERMYRVYEPMRSTLGERLFNAEELAAILFERTHPENR